MRNRAERRRFRLIIAALITAGLLLLLGVFYVFILPLLTVHTEELIPIPELEDGKWRLFQDGVLTYDGYDVTYTDRTGQAVFSVPGKSGIHTGDSTFVLYGGDTFALYGSDGQEIFTRSVKEPVSVRAGDKLAAALYKGSGEEKDFIEVYSPENPDSPEDTVSIGDETVVDYGFYKNYMWVLTMEASSYSPISRVNIYEPAKQTMMTSVTVRDQLVSDIVLYDGGFTVVGSNHLMCYDYSGSQVKLKDSLGLGVKLIYGWQLAAYSRSGKELQMAFAQRPSADAPVSVCWLMNNSKDDSGVRISLPSGTHSVCMGDGLLYAVSGSEAQVYGIDGRREKTISFGRETYAAYMTPDKKAIILRTAAGCCVLAL